MQKHGTMLDIAELGAARRRLEAESTSAKVRKQADKPEQKLRWAPLVWEARNRRYSGCGMSLQAQADACRYKLSLWEKCAFTDALLGNARPYEY